MQEAVGTRTPTHLWIVGILSLLWNSFGAYDYLMTRMRNTEYLSNVPGVSPQEMLAYIDGFPLWSQIAWGFGVWGALLGSVLLLLRSRYAVHAFAVSLLGAVVSLAYQLTDKSAPPALSEGGMQYVPVLIVVLAAAQLWYAWRQSANRVLR